MDALACINFPSLALQLLLRRYPAWAHGPCAVVDREEPPGHVLAANHLAMNAGVRSGQRHAMALALCPEVRVAAVSADEINEVTASLTHLFQRFTPFVEPYRDEPGIFWLDAHGLQSIFSSHERWSREIGDALLKEKFTSVLVIGFSRFGSYAIASALAFRILQNPSFLKADFRVRTIESFDAENAQMHKVPLAHLEFEAKTLALLTKLGIHTIEDFLRLSASGVEKRFGKKAHALYELANRTHWDPLRAAPPPPIRAASIDLEESVTEVDPLLFFLKRLLDPFLRTLRENVEAVTSLKLTFHQENKSTLEEFVRPSEPTLDGALLLNLLRLRLDTLTLRLGITRIALEIGSIRATREQVQLFQEAPRRDLASANRALARVQASFGNASVMRVAIQDRHLPEARFAFEALPSLHLAKPQPASPTLVRYLQKDPSVISKDLEALLTANTASHLKLIGPHSISGAWWKRPIERDYYFAELDSGPIFWVYFDRLRARWFAHGSVA